MHTRRIHRRALLFSALIVISMPGRVGATVVGNIFSGPTSADPAALYWNPAAMTLLHGTVALFFGGATDIDIDYARDVPAAFDEPPLNGELYPVANLRVPKPDLSFGLVTDASLERFRFGVGVSVPQLEGAQWKLEYPDAQGELLPASTRYYGYDGRQVQIFIGFAAAYQINRFISVAVGLDVVSVWLVHRGFADLAAKVNQITCRQIDEDATSCPLDAPLAREDPQYDALTDVEGVGWDVGLSAGVLVTPLPWLAIGLGFHSGSGTVDVPVTMDVSLPPKARDYLAANLPSVQPPELYAKGTVQTRAPMHILAGISLTPIERLELAFALRWVNTSTMAVMLGTVRSTTTELIGDQVLVKGLDDEWEFEWMAAYQLLAPLRLGLRVEYDPHLRPERWMAPMSMDFHKVQLELGLQWQITPWIALGLEYGHFFLVSRTVRESFFRPQALPTTPLEEGLDKPPPTGHYSGHANRVGGTLQLSF